MGQRSDYLTPGVHHLRAVRDQATREPIAGVMVTICPGNAKSAQARMASSRSRHAQKTGYGLAAQADAGQGTLSARLCVSRPAPLN